MDSEEAWEVVAATASLPSPWIPRETAIVLAAMCQTILELRDAQTVLGEAYLKQ